MFSEWIGHWDHGALNGYGRITYCEDTVEEGLYENSDIVKEENHKNIKTYDLGSRQAQKIDFDEYKIPVDKIPGYEPLKPYSDDWYKLI